MKGVSRRCCSRAFVFMTLKSQSSLDSCENVWPVLVSRKLIKNSEAQTIMQSPLDSFDSGSSLQEQSLHETSGGRWSRSVFNSEEDLAPLSHFTSPGTPECQRCAQSARPKGIRRVGFSSLIFKIVFEGLAGVPVFRCSPTPLTIFPSTLHPQQRPG